MRFERFLAATVLTGFALLSQGGQAAVFGDPSTIGGAAQTMGSIEKAGCYRLGLTGYHYYSYCIGPSFMYPKHCTTHHGIKICH